MRLGLFLAGHCSYFLRAPMVEPIAAVMPVFHPFGLSHWVVMGLTLALPVFFWATARGAGKEGYRAGVRFALAGLLLVNFAGYEISRAMVGKFDPADALPMQLCDWAMFSVVAALATRRQWLYELGYFWGLSGTFQAILTPNLQEGFPSLRFISFFIDHSGIVVGVLFLTAVEGMRPRWASIGRVVLWSQVYLVAALTANALTGADYGFLAHPPPVKSLLSDLSSNHWLYVLEIDLLALGFYLALYVPFFVWDLIRPTPPARDGRGSRWLP
jgi:hypothetical integral membrane protein (TIGR02206 family)